MRIAAVTAVDAERDAVGRGASVHSVVRLGPYSALSGTTAGGDSLVVLAAGVGPAAAAAAAMAGALDGVDALLSMGIAGAYGDLRAGDVVVASDVVAADLGATSPGRFLDLATLGFGPTAYTCEPRLVGLLADALAQSGLRVTVGPVLTLSSVTGTDERAAELLARHGAVAEAMEGAGVAHVATVVGVPMLEVRTISNAVGVRDLASWDIPGALTALESASRAIFTGRMAGQ